MTDRATTGEYWGGEELTPEAYRLGAGECYSIYLSICISVYPNNLSIYLNNSVSLCLPGLHSTCRVQTCSVENIVECRHVRVENIGCKNILFCFYQYLASALYF